MALSGDKLGENAGAQIGEVFKLLAGEEAAIACQPMRDGVAVRCSFAFRGLWASAALGVEAVRRDLPFCRHWSSVARLYRRAYKITPRESSMHLLLNKS
jgi:hypothetical protein